TTLSYRAQASVGGKLAQVGTRLIESTARKLADQFFVKFTATVGGSPGEAVPVAGAAVAEGAENRSAIEPAVAPAAAVPARATEKTTSRGLMIVLGALAAAAVVLLLLSR